MLHDIISPLTFFDLLIRTMKYIQRKGNRIKSSRFWDATVFINDYRFIYNDDSYTDGYWGKTKWDEKGKEFGHSTASMPIKSVRAFRRRLKQWKGQLPKGTEVTLVSQYRNYDVIGVIR